MARFNDNFAPKISQAVLPLGLPKSSLPAFIQALSSSNTTALAAVPGATDKIVAAGVEGVKEAYVLTFRYVWVAAGCFTALATICKWLCLLPKDLPISEEKRAPELPIFKIQTLANSSFSATFFIVDPTKEFNMNIDAPAEEYEDLFA